MNDALGDFEKLILLALARHDGAHGVLLRQEIEGRTGRQISAGALYTALERLENKGLVRSEMGEPTPARGGRRKRHYHLLHTGETVLAERLEELRRMSLGLEGRLRLS